MGEIRFTDHETEALLDVIADWTHGETCHVDEVESARRKLELSKQGPVPIAVDYIVAVPAETEELRGG